VNGLVEGFDSDNRHFTGREFTEPRVRVLKKLIDAVPQDSAKNLAKLGTNLPYNFRAGTPKQVLITVTSAAYKNTGAALKKETDAIYYKIGITHVEIMKNANEFVRTARKEGFIQALEAVKEFYEVRQGIIEGGPDVEESQQSEGPGGGGGGSKESNKKSESWERDICDILFQKCLNNPWQPDRNKKKYGPKKDCLACLFECRNDGGAWPFYKCPFHSEKE